MTDIVERLRASVTKGHEPTDEDAIEAADEIERLRATVNRVIDDLETVVFCDGHTRLQPCEPECHCVQHYDAVRELIR
jgi:hypothetical protein